MSTQGAALDVSLGAIGDLLWVRVPEARPDIRNMVVDAVDTALDLDRPIWNLPQIGLCSLVWHRLLSPAFAVRDQPAIRRAMEVMNEILLLDPSPSGVFTDALGHGVIEHIVDPDQRAMLHEASAEIYKRIRHCYWIEPA